jgi:hypothetical protein
MGILERLGFKSFGPELVGMPMMDALKAVGKHLHGENAAQFKQDIEQAKRIHNLQGISASAKLRQQEAIDLKYRNGAIWLALVFALLEQDKSILVDVMDLPGEVRKILAQEKEKRATMPEAMQKLLDAIVYAVEQKHIFNTSASLAANDNAPSITQQISTPAAANDNDADKMQKAA